MMLCLKHNLLILLIAATGLLVSGDTVITCDGDIHRLSCNTGLIIVTSTVYGRADASICPNPSHKTNANCEIPITTVAERCNGQRVCEINTPSLVTRDPCPQKHFKYFITTYGCTDGQDITIFKSGSHTLDCGEGIIEIINANWGRSDSTAGSNGFENGQRGNAHCNDQTALSVVQSECNGQHSCIVEASQGPCHAPYKYLSVAYKCSRKIVTCEGQSADLSCGAFRIKIINAEYGRTDSSTCSANRPAEQLAITTCVSSNSEYEVKTRCDGQIACSVPATNTVFNDPCPGTYKYLTIEYICV